jgi:pyruvate dehydrogenase E1 component alpha subunit
MPNKVIEEFKVSHLQILDESGTVDKKLEPDLSREELLGIYRAMALSREADQRMLKLQRQGRMGTFGPCTGQEASAVAPAYAMAERDWMVGAFREIGGHLVRGVPLLNYLLYWNGVEEGNLRPPGTERVLPVSVIVGSHLLHAVGIAYAMRYRKEHSAAVAFLGDGATSEGDFHEALNFAAVWQAPVVFICQNNHWAISIPRSAQTRSKTIAQKAIAYDIPGIQVDGNDALAMYQATKEALERAHAGDGPTLIEAVTYRMMMHTTADDPTKYRTDEEVEVWKPRDPLIRFRAYLESKGYWNEDQELAQAEEIKAEVDAAVGKLESYPALKPDVPFDHVYGTQHAEIEEQRREFLANLEKEAADGR